MALAMASAPSLTSGVGSTRTTSSFTPPDGSLIVALCGFTQWDQPANVSASGGGLTWTRRAWYNDGPAVAIFTAPRLTSGSMTVSVTSAHPGGDSGALKVLVFTGADLSAVGASNTGDSNTSNLTVAAYTSTRAGSWGVGVAADWNASGSPTSSDVAYPWHISEELSGVVVHKASATPIAGTPVTLNFNGGSGGSRWWAWAALEILPTEEEGAGPLRLVQVINSVPVHHRAATW